MPCVQSVTYDRMPTIPFISTHVRKAHCKPAMSARAFLLTGVDLCALLCYPVLPRHSLSHCSTRSLPCSLLAPLLLRSNTSACRSRRRLAGPGVSASVACS